jgi:hypothetical protein
MSGKPLLVLLPLLLISGVVLADESPEPERVPAANETPAPTKEVDYAARGSGEDADTDKAQSKTEDGAKLISGMSILGNQEAPKSLVIVPWKSSEIGASVGISMMLDDSRRPVDREVFMRALSYYEIRKAMTP